MRHRQPWVLTMCVVVGLTLAACARTSEGEAAGADPATVEPIEGSDVARVALSADAARRLDIQTAPVRGLRATSGGATRMVIPYAAVLYDPTGATWTYTNPEPLVYVRAPISVEHIEGDEAVLSSGPPNGMEVVTVGAAELLGTEYEVGEE
jgi:hypothetical protein